MNVQEKETKIDQQLRQVSVAQEKKCCEIRELEELEADYFLIHYQEQCYYQTLIDNNQGSQYIGHFLALDKEAQYFHQYERQRLEEIAERLVDEEVQLKNIEDRLFAERTMLFSCGQEVEEQYYEY